MKAVLLHGYGDVGQLHYEDAPTPRPADDEVLVRVIATSVNPIDYKLRAGELKAQMSLEFPVILGRDVAGQVEEAGRGVTRFRPGDRVMGLVNHSYAEFLTAKADTLAKIPEGLDAKDAGVLPLILETGSQLIEKGVQPRAGETVLVTGAAGSVGRTAVFVAKQHGARVIAGVRAAQRREARDLGADQVVALDEDADIGGLGQIDAIADTVNGDTLRKLIPRLAKSGRIASVLGKPDAARDAGIDVRTVYAQPDPERLFRLAKDVRERRLKIPIAERMPLARIREAHQAAEKGGGGKIQLSP